MQITTSELRRTITEVLLEVNNLVFIEESFRKLRVVDTSKKVDDDYEKPTGSLEKGTEAQTNDVENEIEDLRTAPEFKDLDSFMSMKLEDDDLSYGFIELQALARNLTAQRTRNKAVTAASKVDVEAVRNTLEKEVGFKFVPRQPNRSTRGIAGSAHGTHPFAGAGGGGSGFSSDREGGGFSSFGGGPGAIGGGYVWKAGDKKNLPMGSRR